MMNVHNHLQTIVLLTENHFDINLANQVSAEKVENLMELYQGKQTVYKNHPGIQLALLNDPDFLDYFNMLSYADVNMGYLNLLLERMDEHCLLLTDYPIENVIYVLKSKNAAELFNFDYWGKQGRTRLMDSYIRYCGDCIILNNRRTIIHNLDICLKSYPDFKVENLTAQQKQLFTKPFFQNVIWNAIRTGIGENEFELSIQILAGSQSLQEFLSFIETIHISCFPSFEMMKKIEQIPNVHVKMKIIFLLLHKDTLLMEGFLNNWYQNCSLNDLTRLTRQLTTGIQLKPGGFSTTSGYLNIVYGGMLKNLNLAYIDKVKDEFILYCLSNKKKAFLKLLENNPDIFDRMPKTSILFNEKFRQLVNVNSMNLHDLKACMNMDSYGFKYVLLKNSSYTFPELAALYKQKEAYYIFYHQLDGVKTRDKLLFLRQLTKKDALSFEPDNNEISLLAEKLKKKPLYNWIREEFSNIKDISGQQAVQMILGYDKLVHLLPFSHSKSDAQLLINNLDSLATYTSMEDLKQGVLITDKSWQKLKEELNLEDDFISRYSKTILSFVCNGYSSIALTYLNQLGTAEQRKKYNFIIKAELMGKLNEIKYYQDDLSKELEFSISNLQKDTWMKNESSCTKHLLIQEYDDFGSTMKLGTSTGQTCLSYHYGMYAKCLLSAFDANKKIIYADKRFDETTSKRVMRAILRLTKIRYTSPGDLQFQDPEYMQDYSAGNISDIGECLALFLERPYRISVTPQEQKNICREMIQLAAKKAKSLNAILVLAPDYASIVSETTLFVQQDLYLFISRSKAGMQYLDSLGGEATATDEGSYRCSKFYVQTFDTTPKGW